MIVMRYIPYVIVKYTILGSVINIWYAIFNITRHKLLTWTILLFHLISIISQCPFQQLIIINKY